MRLVYRSPNVRLAPIFLSRDGQQGFAPFLLALQMNILFELQSDKCLGRYSM